MSPCHALKTLSLCAKKLMVHVGGLYAAAASQSGARLHAAGMAEARRAKSGLLQSVLHQAEAEGSDSAVQPPPGAASSHVPEDAAAMDGACR